MKHAQPTLETVSTKTSAAEIEIKNLFKIYKTASGDPVSALEDVSLSIGAREFVSVVGPSGCGKTTLLRIVGGLVQRTSGDVSIRGEAISGPTRDVGIVFQKAVLLPWKTVIQNVLVPAIVLGLDIDAATKRARELLDLVGLTDFEDKYPNELSGGMQQRVSIARALIHEPSLLLMDEPFGALDAMTREFMNLELQRISREAEITVLFITHSIQEAVFLGDRVIVMTARPGQIAKTFDIDLPRPRELDGMSTKPFGDYVSAIRDLLQAKGLTH